MNSLKYLTRIGCLVLASTSAMTFASDHKEAPLIAEDPSADLADLFAFVSPDANDHVILAMTVNPFSVPSEATAYNFSPNVRYTFHIDTDNDGVEESNINVRFSKRLNGKQSYTVMLPDGSTLKGQVTMPTEEPVANEPVITMGDNGVRAFAGPRDDPFFFDVVGFNRFAAGTGGFSGADGFAGFNTSAIVLDIPVSMLNENANSFQVWASTERHRITLRRAYRGKLEINVGDWEQVDRVGNPAVNTALIPAGKKDLFNIVNPDSDAPDFAGDIVASLTALGTNEENIGILASVALPDTLKVDLSSPTHYPNGRSLEDDVIDTLFFFIFNQTEVSDGAQMNDADFLPTFPYLATPHQAE